jgi:SWI/SNF-related matrix-associated actin-dependent regulator 1 of chromatin subfamily A
MQILNKFDKKCCVCGTMVETGKGFASNVRGPWQTYCKAHAPEQIQARQAPSTERKLGLDGYVTMPYEPDNLALLQAMPGAKWHAKDCQCGCGGRKQWSVSVADQDRMRVLEIADQLQLQVDPVLRTLSQADYAVLPAGLYPFQEKGVQWLSRRDRALLGDDMGLGKTIQALLSLAKDDRVIVICPNTLKYNWAKEAAKWRPEFSVRVLSSHDRKTGGFPVPKANEIVVVNYDILPKWLNYDATDETAVANLPKGLDRLKGITLIVDEAHFLTNYKAQRSRKVKNFANLVSRVWFLTGTALTTNPGNLWSVLGAAGLQHEAFGSWTNFKRLFGARTKSKWGGIEWSTEVDRSVPERLRRVMLRRIRTEVLPDLPKKTYQDVEVNDIPDHLQSQLDAVWAEQGDLLEVEQTLPGFEEFSKIKNELAIAKIPALLEMVEEHEEQNIPLVVFSDHIAPVDACGARQGWGVIKGGMKPEDRQAVIDAFQAGQLKGIALTITAGGTGLTLTHAWKAIFNDLNWTPANNIQAEDRICRIGQTKPCQITRLITRHPLEKHIHSLIAKKMALIANAIDATVTAAAPVAPQGSQVTVKGETQQEYQDRMDAILKAAQELEAKVKAQAEAEKVIRAKSKVEGILVSERSRNNWIEPIITPTLADEIRKGIRFMASVCDGAVAKDFQGFNRPDTMRGHLLALAGLNDVNELLAAWHILKRYPRQWQFSN